jgi:hypothetical protein
MDGGSPNEIEHVLDRLVEHLKSTELQFCDLMRSDRITHPIPFFGDIRAGRLLTVGVNPSAEEFAPDRAWPQSSTSTADLAHRLLSYLDRPVQPHPWFGGWRGALTSIGISYPQHAAHLDLSPRATFGFGRFTRGPRAQPALREKFVRMVETDLSHFCQFLDLCTSARVVLLAGGVTNVYMDDFLARRLDGSRIRFPSGRAKQGHAPVTRLEICIGNVGLGHCSSALVRAKHQNGSSRSACKNTGLS